jgi:MOSC domain-containing protein YiiM
MHDRGGAVCRVLTSGAITVGDPVVADPARPEPEPTGAAAAG